MGYQVISFFCALSLKSAFIFIFFNFQKKKGRKTMKQTLKISISLISLLAICLCVFSCAKPETGLWKDATYTKDTTLGEGSVTVKVDVVAEDKTVTFTLKTDAKNLGEALYSLELINDASFFDTLNGMRADWSTDKAYWAFYKGDEYMMVGVDRAPVSEGTHYRLVYTVG